MEDNVDIINLVLAKLDSEDIWFTSKLDPTIEEASSYYQLDEYGEPTEKTVKKIEKEVLSLIGDGAVDIMDAVELWKNDQLCAFRLDFKDNLVTKYADKPVVDNIEAYENPVQFPQSKKTEAKTKKTEYYKMPDDEHIIWDSEVDYYDDDYMEDVKQNQYQDYLDDFEPSEPPTFEDWVMSEECYDTHYNWFEDTGITEWSDLVDEYRDEFKEDYDDYVANYKDEPLPFDKWYSNYIKDASYDDWEYLEDDLKSNIFPEIDKQVNDDVLILSGYYGSNYPDFKSSGAGGKLFENGTKDFRDYMGNFDRVCITTQNGILGAVLGDHDGTVSGQFFTLPDDKSELFKALDLENKVKEDYTDQEIDWENGTVGEYDSMGNYRNYDLEDLVEKEFYELLEYGGLDARDFTAHIELLKPIKDTISGYANKSESKKLKTEDTTSSEFTLLIRPEELEFVNTSALAFDSDTTIAIYKEGNYELSLMVRGSIKIVNKENGDVYKNWQSYPDDLKEIITSGEIEHGGETDKYIIDMNNWFEWFLDKVEDNVVDNVWYDVADIEGMLNKPTPEENETELEVIMKDLFDDIAGQLNEGKKLEVKSKSEAKFKDKVNAIKKSLKKNDKRLSDKTAEKSAEKIAGSMIKKEDKQIKTEKSEMSKEDIKNLLDNGNIIKVGGKTGYTPTKFLEKDGKIYFLNREITWGAFIPHSKNINEMIDYIFNLQKEGFKITSEDWDDKVKIEENKITENYQKRLNEVNTKSETTLNDMITSSDFDSDSKAGQIVIRTQELFNVLSDMGYDVDVAFDNGESTSSIQLGMLGGKVVITITDTDKPLRAFISGNFEITDDNLKIFKDIEEQLTAL